MFEFKLIVPIKDVPEGSTVIKINGEKRHIVKNSLKVYSDKGLEKEITFDDGSTKAIIDERGNINVLPGNKEIIWLVEGSQLINFIEDQYEGL